MRESKFCLMLPGDGASSRRTSEIIMTGCVPVWLGPSYATMPFADVVDYKKSALFFNVSQHRWAAAEMGLNLPILFGCVQAWRDHLRLDSIGRGIQFCAALSVIQASLIQVTPVLLKAVAILASWML